MNEEMLAHQLRCNHDRLDGVFDKELMTHEELAQLETTKHHYNLLFSGSITLAAKELVVRQYEHVISMLQSALMNQNAPQIKKTNPVRVHGLAEQVVLDLVLLLKAFVWLSVASFSAVLAVTIIPSPMIQPIIRTIAMFGFPIILTAAAHGLECLHDFSFFSPAIAARKEHLKRNAKAHAEQTPHHVSHSIAEDLRIILESLFWVAAIATTVLAGGGGLLLGVFAESLPVVAIMMIGTVSTLVAEGKKAKECVSRLSLFSTAQDPVPPVIPSVPVAVAVHPMDHAPCTSI